MRVQPNAGILREAFASQYKDNLCPELLRRTLENIVNRHKITDVLRGILCSRKRVQELTGHAYFHTNGFDKLVLDSLGEFGCKLRLHVWRGNGKEVESTVHDHPWDFASHLVAGKMTMRLYEEDHEGLEFFIKAQYPTKALPEIREPITMGRARLKCTDVSKYEIGMAYALTRGQLHSVTPMSERLVTLVLQGPHFQNTSRVYARRESELRSPMVQEYFSSAEIVERLAALVD
jgi:hypothetical protein